MPPELLEVAAPVEPDAVAELVAVDPDADADAVEDADWLVVAPLDEVAPPAPELDESLHALKRMAPHDTATAQVIPRTR